MESKPSIQYLHFESERILFYPRWTKSTLNTLVSSAPLLSCLPESRTALQTQCSAIYCSILEDKRSDWELTVTNLPHIADRAQKGVGLIDASPSYAPSGSLSSYVSSIQPLLLRSHLPIRWLYCGARTSFPEDLSSSSGEGTID